MRWQPTVRRIDRAFPLSRPFILRGATLVGCDSVMIVPTSNE
ncbi:hypothetical protein [Bradyrhizobium sp.]